MDGYTSVLKRRLDRQNEPTVQVSREDVINLFLPRDKGTTLSSGMIAKRLDLSGKRELIDLGFMLVNLINNGILYERRAIPGIYIINPPHLWKDRKLRQEYEAEQMQQAEQPIQPLQQYVHSPEPAQPIQSPTQPLETIAQTAQTSKESGLPDAQFYSP